jgi:hypothetical protein
LKRAISIALGATKERPLWQPGFFDYVLSNDESYGEKWKYVQENPVRVPDWSCAPTNGRTKVNLW